MDPQEIYKQPGALDHARRNWFALHHIAAYSLFGLLGLVVISGVYYYQLTQAIPDFAVPAHHAKDLSTYTSALYNFQFTYPAGWPIIDKLKVKGQNGSITVGDNKGGSHLTSLYPICYLDISFQATSTSVIPAFFPRNFYALTSDGESCQKNLDQITSSFKFIK